MINDGGFDLEALVYTLYNTLLIRHSLATEIVRFETDNYHTISIRTIFYATEFSSFGYYQDFFSWAIYELQTIFYNFMTLAKKISTYVGCSCSNNNTFREKKRETATEKISAQYFCWVLWAFVFVRSIWSWFRGH